MAAFSGKKHLSHETTMTRSVDSARRIPMANPKSENGKYLPVRISTADFDGPPGSRNPSSSRKTLGLSSRKPIRNLHKLLESPKRTVRKRLDKLYDYSKPKENGNPSIVKTQALSAKKFAPKTPVTSATKKFVPKSPVNSARKLSTKSGKVPPSQNPRQSRLLPPGTITGSFLNGRNSLASRTFIHKPTHNRLTLVQKNPRPRGPSDVPEESPQPLESSFNTSGEEKRLPTLNYTSNKSTEGLKEIDSNGSTNIHKDSLPLSKPQDEKESSHCPKCSRITDESKQSENDTNLADPCPKILLNNKETTQEDTYVIHDENKTKASFQRPTVIVMQKESAPQLTVQDLEESLQIPMLDGSYSEILSLRPSANSSLVDESLLFRRTESACTRSESTGDSNSRYNTTEFICMLLKQREFLTQSISEYEKNLTIMKLTLKKVDAQLSEQEALKLGTKLETLSELPGEELAKNSQTSRKEGFEFSEKANEPEEEEKKSNPESVNVESQAEEESKDSAKDKSAKAKQSNKNVENIENEPPQRRRSARLAKKNAGDLSVPVVEQNTPASDKQKIIKLAKSKPNSTPGMTTPLRSARWGRRSERPLREYMVLKSAIKFLNTPDSRRYRIGSDEKVKIRDSLDKTDEALLSDKLLKELHDLYATP